MLGLQRNNRLSAVGICRIVSCILHSDNLVTVYFDLDPSECFRHDAWQREGLPMLPAHIANKGWTAVLEFSRNVRSIYTLTLIIVLTCVTPQPRSQLLLHISSLILNASAVGVFFGPRSVGAHYLQPHAQLGFTRSRRSLDRAMMQLRCDGNKQRVLLLCHCGPLFALAFLLPRSVNKHAGSCSFEHRATARIMKRCFSVFATRIWSGVPRSSKLEVSKAVARNVKEPCLMM
jgi:hypothetical protein